MKNSRIFLMIAFVLVLLVSACQGGNPLQPPNCKRGTCVKVALVRSAKLGEDATLTLTINSDVDEPEAMVYWQFTDPDVLIDGQPTEAENRFTLKSKTQFRPSQTITFTSNLKFPHEGYYTITAHILTKEGRDVFQGLWIHVTAGGITPNPPPERGPGTPGSAIKLDKTPTPRPQTPTRIPPPTQPAYP